MKRLGRDTVAVWLICAVAAVFLATRPGLGRPLGLLFVAATAVEAWVADAWRRTARAARADAEHWRNVALLASMQLVERLNEPAEDDGSGDGANAQ